MLLLNLSKLKIIKSDALKKWLTDTELFTVLDNLLNYSRSFLVHRRFYSWDLCMRPPND